MLAGAPLAVLDGTPLASAVPVFLQVAALGAGLGLAMGLLGCLPVRALTLWLWSRARPLAFLVGPSFGMLAGVPLAVALDFTFNGGSPNGEWIALMAGGSAGATLAPTWPAYLVTRSRGRSSCAPLAVALAWAPVPLWATLGLGLLTLS